MTPHGLLDVVPRIAGPFDWLRPRARLIRFHGVPVRVALPDDLVAPMRVGTKPTHRVRIAALLRAGDRVRRGDAPEPRLP